MRGSAPGPWGGRVAAGITQHILGDLNKIAYLSDVTVLGARIGTGIVVPVIANATVSGNLSTNVPGASVFRSGTISGFGDIYVTPLIANWALGNYNLSLQPGVTVPSGGYRTDRALNLGRNYWSFDMAGSFTWFDPTRGMDISVTPGVMFNTTNQATNYHTGTEFHLDWSVGQFLSKSFGVAVVGYVYTQLESDDGTLIGPLRARDFRGSGIGVGAVRGGEPADRADEVQPDRQGAVRCREPQQLQRQCLHGFGGVQVLTAIRRHLAPLQRS